MISATVMTAQTTINIINGDIRHLGSGEPALPLIGLTLIAHQVRGPHGLIISTLAAAVASYYRGRLRVLTGARPNPWVAPPISLATARKFNHLTLYGTFRLSPGGDTFRMSHQSAVCYNPA